MKTLLIFLLAFTSVVMAQTTTKPVYTDASGNVLSSPIVWSNNFQVIQAPTNANHAVRFVDLTNSTSVYPIPISKGGTGTNTTQLTGSWTNTLAFTASNLNLTVPLSIGNGGSGTNTTQLTGNYTNTGTLTILGNAVNPASGGTLSNAASAYVTVNITIGGTNRAEAFQIGSILGKTFTQTNLSAVAGVSNVIGVTLGIVTTNFTIP